MYCEKGLQIARLVSSKLSPTLGSLSTSYVCSFGARVFLVLWTLVTKVSLHGQSFAWMLTIDIYQDHFQLFGLGGAVKTGGEEGDWMRVTEWINDWPNHNAVFRGASVTPGLLIITAIFGWVLTPPPHFVSDCQQLADPHPALSAIVSIW